MRDDWVKLAVRLATLTIINSVYGNRGNQAVVSFTRIQKYIEGGGIRLKKPVRDAFSDPVLSGFIRSSRVKYHVHLILRMLASNGFLVHDKRHRRFIITRISPLWEPAYSGNVSELYEVIMRVVGGFMSDQRHGHHSSESPTLHGLLRELGTLLISTLAQSQFDQNAEAWYKQCGGYNNTDSSGNSTGSGSGNMGLRNLQGKRPRYNNKHDKRGLVCYKQWQLPNTLR